MENMVTHQDFWQGKKVLVTGHTGFKGSWLSLWLQQKGADVTGLSLDPPTNPSLFVKAGVAEQMNSIIGDIRDLALVKKVFVETPTGNCYPHGGPTVGTLFLSGTRGNLRDQCHGDTACA